MSDDAFSHQSVLLQESIDALVTKTDGFYIDATYGRGGHSRYLLKQLDSKAKLWVFDKDPLAIANAQDLARQDERVTVFNQSFSLIKEALHSHDQTRKVDGLLCDFGVSSPQLDDAKRGFSFLKDGPLDMRMNPDEGQSVAEFLASAAQDHISEILFQYGEESQARKIAKAIKNTSEPLTTTSQLAQLIQQVKGTNPAQRKHPATQSFQALRIYINKELEDISKLCKDLDYILAPKGALVAISFHSLEDKIIKKVVQGDQTLLRDLPFAPEHHVAFGYRIKKCLANDVELAHNVRARSAIMRVIERRSV